MKYQISFQTERGKGTGELLVTKQIKDYKNQDRETLSWSKGQTLRGVIISVNENITLDFDGHKLTAHKDVIKDAKVGETRYFEVKRAKEGKIELKAIEETITKSKQLYNTSLHVSDQELVKENSVRARKKANKEQELLDKQSQLEQIAARLTPQDVSILEEEGLYPEHMSIEALYRELTRIKSMDTESDQLLVPQEAFASEEVIAEILKAHNLPADKMNLQRVTAALKLGETARQMNDQTIRQLISKELEPTIENIYMAFYSGNHAQELEERGLSDREWKELEASAKAILSDLGYETDQENLSKARWLIGNNLPFNEKTLQDLDTLHEIKAHAIPELIMNKIIDGMKQGILPKDVSLQASSKEVYDQLMADIASITDETITQSIEEDPNLTIRRLIHGEPVKQLRNETDLGSYETIKAKRQLEEIRLRMTMEAAVRLEKQGISIETEGLEQLVDALRGLEEDYYKELFRDVNVEATDHQLQLLKETTAHALQLRELPSYVLGVSIRDKSLQTITGLVTDGSRLRTELEKAGEAYETLMTVPNREYGDSIQKAFKNMEPLLTELGMENTALNQRAVRALGYNHMEITEESINLVKAYDLEVTSLIKNLHPAVAVRMIKEGMNPLELPIQELNTIIDQMKEEQGISSEERFSNYLRRLEKEEGITKEERKTYIGIYRLLYNIEKSDGAALGAVIGANKEVTLKSLLTAVSTLKRGRMDTIIDDELGALEGLTQDREAIANQIEAAFVMKQDQPQDVASQIKYFDRLLKLMKEEVTPDQLKQAHQGLKQEVTAADSLAMGQGFQPETSEGMWDFLSKLPVEKLYDELINLKQYRQEDAIYGEKVEQLQRLCKNSEQALRFLNDYQAPTTPIHIMMANHIISNGESPIKKLLKARDINDLETSENYLKETEELTDKLISKDSMKQTLDQLQEEAKQVLQQAYSEESMDERRLTELKTIGMQMTFLKTLAEREFYQIPVETDHGVINLNLTILRNSKDYGKLTVAVESENLGNMKAELIIKGGTLKGFLCCDNRRGMEALKECSKEIAAAATEEKLTLRQLDYGILPKGFDPYQTEGVDEGEEEVYIETDMEGKLYRMAKAVIRVVQSAENSMKVENSSAS